MRFEHPTILFFLFLLVVPILIHLFSFRRYKTFYFSSIHFLKNIEEETRNVRKLKHLLVLLTRIFAFTCLIFAFAQPYLPVKGLSNSHASSVLAIYIDNSFSMSSIGSTGNLLSESKEQARKFIENSPVSAQVMLVSNELSGIEQQLCTKSEALNRLDKLTLSPLHHRMSEVLNWMEESVKEKTSSNTTKQFVVLSDFQKNQSDLADVSLDKESYFYPIQIIPQQKQNVSIDSVWFNEPNFKVRINNEMNIKLTNHGEEDVENLELQFSVNKTKRTVFVALPKKSSKNVQLNYSDLTTGEKVGQIHINDKNLHFDDDYYFTYTVHPHANVLLIQGEDASSLVAKTYRLDSYYHIQEVANTAFLPENTLDKQLIILNGVNALNEGINDALHKFTLTGGSVILFPGTDIAKQPWNSLLNQLRLPSIKTLVTEKMTLSSINYADPFFQGVFEKKPVKLNLSILKKNYVTGNSIYSTSLLTLQNKQTLLFKSGNSYLFTSSLDSTFSSFTQNALFPSFLLRTAELSQQKSELALIIGQSSRYPLHVPLKQDAVFHLKGEGIDFIPTIEKIDRFTYLSLLGAPVSTGLKQGVYRLENDGYLSSLALNYDRKESDITFYSEQEIKSYLTKDKFPQLFYKSTQLGDQNLKIALEKPREYWRIFLLLSLLFLFTEMALLKFLR